VLLKPVRRHSFVNLFVHFRLCPKIVVPVFALEFFEGHRCWLLRSCPQCQKWDFRGFWRVSDRFLAWLSTTRDRLLDLIRGRFWVSDISGIEVLNSKIIALFITQNKYIVMTLKCLWSETPETTFLKIPVSEMPETHFRSRIKPLSGLRIAEIHARKLSETCQKPYRLL